MRLPELTREDLWIFAFEKGKTRFKDFEEFCHNAAYDDRPNLLARQTMDNYLKDLRREGKLKRALAEGERWPHYYVPKEYHKKVATFKKNRMIISVLVKDPSRFLETLKTAVFNATLRSDDLNGELDLNPFKAIHTGYTDPPVELRSPEDVDHFLLKEGYSEEQILELWIEGKIMSPFLENDWDHPG